MQTWFIFNFYYFFYRLCLIRLLKCYYDQKFMSRMKQKCVLYSLSDLAVPVLVTEMKFGPRKLKILNLEKCCLSSPPLWIYVPVSPRYEKIGLAVIVFKPIVSLSWRNTLKSLIKRVHVVLHLATNFRAVLTKLVQKACLDHLRTT